jgi:uncharacterized protein (TIGR03643 family)
MPKLNVKFTEEETSRIIEMAWEDRTTFESILDTFGINESQVMRLMQKNLKRSSYRLWRKRVKQKSIKHKKLRPKSVTRAYCPTQYKLSR